MSDKKAAVKKNRWTRLIQKYEKSEKVNQLIFVKYKGKSKADIILYKKANGKRFPLCRLEQYEQRQSNYP